jgi:hypothetical protein
VHLTALCTPCIGLVFMAPMGIFAIDHAAHGREEHREPSPVETADIEQDQGKLWCI